MSLVRRGLVVVLDGKGDLSPWLSSASASQLGTDIARPQVLYIGRDGACPGVPTIVCAEEQPFPREELQAAFRQSVNTLSDAQQAFELRQKGIGVASSTIVMFVGRASDPLVVAYFTDVMKFLHRLADRYFPQQQFTWSSVLMLPNLFVDPTYEDFGRTYALIKQVDGYQQDPPPFKTASGVPTRLLDTIWLANSVNESGATVGRFPDAGEALSTFLQAVLDGSVSCAAPPLHRLIDGKRPNYSSFGCTVLSLDREYMNAWLAHKLEKDVIEPWLADVTVTPEATLGEVKQAMAQSQIGRISDKLEAKAQTIFKDLRPSITPENVLFAEGVITQIKQLRSAHEAGAAFDNQMELQRERELLEREAAAEMRRNAGDYADVHGIRAGEQFLNLLANDPQGEIDSPAATAKFTLFNVLGAAIDRLDAMIGYTAGAKAIADQRARLNDVEGRLASARRDRDVLNEQLQSLISRRGSIASMGEDAQVPYLAEVDEKTNAFADIEKLIRTLDEDLVREQATLRGLLIGRRNFRREDRQAAHSEHASKLDAAIETAADEYREAVRQYRDRDGERIRLYEERRSWVIRKVFIVPAVVIGAVIALHLIAVAFVGVDRVVSLYRQQSGALVRLYAAALLIYAGWTGWTYLRAFHTRLRALENELKTRLEATMRLANSVVRSTNARLRFDLDYETIHASVKALYNVRENSRSILGGVQRLLDRFSAAASEPEPAAPSNTLYRSSMWTAQHLHSVYQIVIPKSPDVAASFRAQHGGPSIWMFDEPEGVFGYLRDYGSAVLKPLQSATLEDFFFDSRYTNGLAKNHLTAVFEASVPYLRLQADLLSANSLTQDVVYTKNGRNSRLAEYMHDKGFGAHWEDHDNGDELTVIRTRIGFPAFMLAEMSSYWTDYLRDPSVSRPDAGEEDFPELIPHAHRPLFNTIVESFLLLWHVGDVTERNGHYYFSQTRLGGNRLTVYDRLINDPALSRHFDEMHSRGEKLRLSVLNDNREFQKFVQGASLYAVEREVVYRYCTRQSDI